jgi:hypothetical protein
MSDFRTRGDGAIIQEFLPAVSRTGWFGAAASTTSWMIHEVLATPWGIDPAQAESQGPLDDSRSTDHRPSR